jgi:hypothetical protein
MSSLIASLVVIAVLALTPAGAGSSASTADRPRASAEDCGSKSQGGFTAPFDDPNNLVVGPLSMVFAGGTPEFWEPWPGQKFPLLVRPGHRVTVAVARSAAGEVKLIYGGEPRRAITFIACRRGEWNPRWGRPFWSGGVLTESPRCIPLRIWVDGRPEPRRAVIRLGVETCV